jgi:Spy/CpxP family protein refolding chaperone
MNSPLLSPSRRTLLALVAAAAFAVGGGAVAAAQHVAAAGPHAMSLTASPADLADHIAQFSEHVYAATGATPEQKAQIDPILRQAGSDLAALHAQFGDSHGKMLQALTQDRVDRDALESARAEHIRFADQASQRLARLAADVADVLTPAQRKALAEQIAQHHAAGHAAVHGS